MDKASMLGVFTGIVLSGVSHSVPRQLRFLTDGVKIMFLTDGVKIMSCPVPLGPRPIGAATEEQKAVKPQKRGKGTRKQRKGKS